LEALRPFRRVGEVLQLGVGELLHEHLVDVLVVVALDAVAADVEHQLARSDAVCIAPGAAGALALGVGGAAPANWVRFCMIAGAAARAWLWTPNSPLSTRASCSSRINARCA